MEESLRAAQDAVTHALALHGITFTDGSSIVYRHKGILAAIYEKKPKTLIWRNPVTDKTQDALIKAHTCLCDL